jgi:hypothetical protein
MWNDSPGCIIIIIIIIIIIRLDFLKIGIKIAIHLLFIRQYIWRHKHIKGNGVALLRASEATGQPSKLLVAMWPQGSVTTKRRTLIFGFWPSGDVNTEEQCPTNCSGQPVS